MYVTAADRMAQALAQTMFHFLWQGLVVGVAAACLVQVVNPRRSQTRYAIYLTAFASLALCPLMTFFAVSMRAPEWQTPGQLHSIAIGDDLAPLAANPAAIEQTAPTTSAWMPTAKDLQTWVERHRMAIALTWLGGVVCCGARLTLGGIRVWTLARSGVPLPADWQQRVERLGRQMRFRTIPAVRVVERVSQAVAVGVFKPIVLLPAAWVCELDGDVLEAVIAHELAHLHRWDLPINFAQRVVEMLLFFHPIVWWCSKRIRIEREKCCDELALEALGNPAQYAKALAELAYGGRPRFEPLLGIGIGGPQMVLLDRIRNVLGMNSLPHGRMYGLACALVGAAVASVIWAMVLTNRPGLETADTQFSGAEDDFTKNHFPIPDGPPTAADTASAAPTERAKTLLPSYTIEPPDVLFIEVLRLMPKAPYRLQTGDELRILSEPPEVGIAASGFYIDPQGRIDLGPRYGKAQVSGMTEDEATEAVRAVVKPFHAEPLISLTLVQTAAMQPITGEHLVSPDGTVNLGTYGQVHVAGLTLGEAKTVIEAHLAQFLDNPQVAVTVFAYNSKVYYVIFEGVNGDTVTRLPITGSETVLDAISRVSGLSGLSRKKIWIARPEPGGGGHETVLPVNWQEITKGAATALNYQVFPGDRIFIVEKPATRTARY